MTSPVSLEPSAAWTETIGSDEDERFDPWSALVKHRPLGEIMRARRSAYRASQLGRGLS